MKLKLTGLAGTALLLLSPVASAMSAVTQAVPVQADNTWDYDVDDPGLGDYDQLLQNAGPSDGIVDWYPTKEALGENPSAQVLVRQLIDLSIATNDKDSDARKVLFNDTTGNNANASYKDTYNKYSVALGFIAQILDFNNAKSGIGARLEQAAVASDNDPQDSDGTGVIRGRIIDDPSNKSLGHNISDVLGTAFFGNADDAYAQIYVNGYDNVAQNEANIIREATSSITIVAQSKTTGKKATAIFKLNNKTLPKGADNLKLNNYVDNSVYALDNKNGNGEIAGLNMTTASQSTIDNLKFSKESTFWAAGTKDANGKDDGSGTIVVPRGTTAKQVAKLIADRKIDSNNSLRESAPMKAIQAANNKVMSDGKTHSYSHVYEREETDPNRHGTSYANYPATPNSGIFNFADHIQYGVNGPGSFSGNFREYNNILNSKLGPNSLDLSSADGGTTIDAIKITDPSTSKTSDAWFGGSTLDNGITTGADHMLDTNEMYDNGHFTNKSASEVPNVGRSEGDPFTDDGSLSAKVEGTVVSPQDKDTHVAGVDSADKLTNIGKVKHLFKPSDYFKEAYDANHFVTNSPALKDSSVDDIANKIASNGSFTGTDPNAEIKKSFTYETPVSAWLYKSYNNPYSTVTSSAGAQTIDGVPIDTSSADQKNKTIQPQKKLDLNNPNDADPDSSTNPISLGDGTSGKPSYLEYLGKDPTNHKDKYFYAGVFQTLNATSNNISNNSLTLDFSKATTNGSVSNPISTGTFKIGAGKAGTLVKYGVIGTDGENPNPSYKETGGIDSGLLSGSATANYSINFSGGGMDTKVDGGVQKYKSLVLRDDAGFFVQTWDKNTRIKDASGNIIDNPQPLIYNKNLTLQNGSAASFSNLTLGEVDSPNFESRYYLTGVIYFDSSGNITDYVLGDHISQTSQSKRAYFNSNLYNNPEGSFAKKDDGKDKKETNNSRFFVSQDFSVGPVSSDMVSDPGGTDLKIGSDTYPAYKTSNTGTLEENAQKILDLTIKYNDPTKNPKNITKRDAEVKNEFTAANGYKLVTLDDAAKNQGTTVDALANEVAKVTGKTVQDVKRTKWLEASLPRVKSNAGTARINVVIYDKAAVSAPTKEDTKPSFSTTDISGGNDPFNVSFRPYTTTYDDGAVLKAADVPQNFKNLLSKTLVAGNPDLVGSTAKLQQILVSTFLDSWQQNDGSFKQTDTGAGVNSPLYMYGGFGISNSDTKNSYAHWPKGYTDNSGEYNTAITNHQGDFYRGGVNLKVADNKGTITGIPFTSLTADVSKVDITKAGTYPVVYTYTNPSNSKDTASITVPVTVSDSSAPVFSFQGTTNTTIHTGDKFDIHNYKVVGSWSIFNNYGGDYNKLPNFEGIAKNTDGTPKVTVTGTVDTHKPGIYQLTYKATSTSGAVTEMVRNITVLPTNGSSNPSNPDTIDWNINAYKAVGYINYVPGYGIMVYNAPAGAGTGQRLAHGTAWKISQRAVNAKGETFYRVGNNQWINGKYVTFSPINTVIPLRGEVMIVYKKGYGVNLWKSASTTNGFYPGRKLMHGSRWKVSGKQNGFYKVGKDQWIQADYAGYKAY
ncbi:immunoglobulin-like domain-containing protein [Xylocopilactobacillus apis]|uniref:DUF5011 domain-containing protein n=1 Tax=Xylocopilactobacillus apis TaxID=2932183 RepID=A0AAU9CWM9_9LACO|nr:immunoglobulin-like domain-containing protein [Xylocopilactobacillus apis]BDR56841.1 hypothetical protein KIMC2_14030 [Xylocopilactobacillus apis]